MQHRKHLLKIPFSFAYWVKQPKLANIFAGFLACYSSRAEIRHAIAILTKRSTSSGCIYTVGTQSVKDKAIRDIIRTAKSPCPGIQPSHILPTTQIRSMSACSDLSQGDFESEHLHCTAVFTCWCSLSEKLFSILCLFSSHPILALLSPSLPAVDQGSRSGPCCPLPTTCGTCLYFFREKNSAFSSLVDSRRIVPTHGAKRFQQ